jgi:hypothetical protein
MESSLIKTLNKEKSEITNLQNLANSVPKIRQKIYILN